MSFSSSLIDSKSIKVLTDKQKKIQDLSALPRYRIWYPCSCCPVWGLSAGSYVPRSQRPNRTILTYSWTHTLHGTWSVEPRYRSRPTIRAQARRARTRASLLCKHSIDWVEFIIPNMLAAVRGSSWSPGQEMTSDTKFTDTVSAISKLNIWDCHTLASVNFISLVTSCVGLRQEEPQTALPCPCGRLI